jgi:hypothetical protein
MRKLFFCIVFSFLVIVLHAQQTGSAVTPIPNTECAKYKQNSWWLPDAYVHNATCACKATPNDSAANIIRAVLQQRMENTPDSLKRLMQQRKSDLKNHVISKRKYRKLVKKDLTPLIYCDHKIAYCKAGCCGDPAPYYAWKFVTTRYAGGEKMVYFFIRWGGGSCSGKWGKW